MSHLTHQTTKCKLCPAGPHKPRDSLPWALPQVGNRGRGLALPRGRLPRNPSSLRTSDIKTFRSRVQFNRYFCFTPLTSSPFFDKNLTPTLRIFMRCMTTFVQKAESHGNRSISLSQVKQLKMFSYLFGIHVEFLPSHSYLLVPLSSFAMH